MLVRDVYPITVSEPILFLRCIFVVGNRTACEYNNSITINKRSAGIPPVASYPFHTLSGVVFSLSFVCLCSSLYFGGIQENMPMTIQTPRICVKDTTLGGLLDKPAKAGRVSDQSTNGGVSRACHNLFIPPPPLREFLQ